jgi:hypothetical protein
MLCSLLKTWNAYTIANSSFGRMFSNQANEPVAMMMSYNHRNVAIVNQREYIPCFTTEIAAKANVPVITIAPDMYKFTTVNNFDHYVFFDESANIKMPEKVQENKKVIEITRKIEKFSNTHEKGEKVEGLVSNVSGKIISPSVRQNIKDMVRQIVQKEHAKEESSLETRKKLGKVLKKQIKKLVRIILRVHRIRQITKRKIRNILSIVKHTKGKGKGKKVKAIKHIIRSIIKMNAQASITPKKIDRILEISRSYPNKIAERRIRRIIRSVIRTRSNAALTKNTIRKMNQYILTQSNNLSERKIQKKIRRMFMNIVNTTVNTIVPKDKVLSIISISKKDLPTRALSTKINNIIHDIRVDVDNQLEDNCNCKCAFKSKVPKKANSKKISLSDVVKLVPTNSPKQIAIRSENGKVVFKRGKRASKKGKRSSKKGKRSSKKGKRSSKKGKRSSKKLRKLSLSKKIKLVSKEIANLKNKKKILKQKLEKVVNELKEVDTLPEFRKLVSRMKVMNSQKKLIEKKVAILNVIKFDSVQKKFAESPIGVKATKVCKQIGATGSVLKGCMQDIRLSRNPKIVLTAVKETIATNKAIQKANIIQRKTGNAPSRTCSAVGDPHFTNFNGDYFHIQQPSIYTFAKTSDGLFEVQVKQSGATTVGTPSYVRDVMIRYDGQLYHGSLDKDGFKVSSGGYVSVTVPGSYQGEMSGICGINGLSKGAQNFVLPDGNVADVNYGSNNWELGGYGGPNTKLSQWHLSWRPSLETCMFSKQECQDNLKDQVANKNRFINTVFGIVDTSSFVKEQPKAAVKEQPKAAVKEQPKAAVKEQPKAVVKEQPKAVVKEQPKAVVKKPKRGVLKAIVKAVEKAPRAVVKAVKRLRRG